MTTPTPLTFRLGSLTINVTADNVALDNYTPPPYRAGILLEADIPISKLNSTFVYLTNTPTVSLLDSMTNVQYACLRNNTGTEASPVYSFENIIPNTLNVGFTLPTADGYTLSDFTASTSVNKTVEYDLMQYIAVNLLYTESEISAALAAVDKKLSNGTTISDPVPGIINSGNFRLNFLNNVKAGFATKLGEYGLNENGEGTPYSANAPTDAQGESLPFNPSLEITRAIFNNYPSRLGTVGTALPNAAALGVKSGLSAFSVPVQVGDILDFNIVVNTSQSSRNGTTIATRTYRIQATIIA